TSTRTARSPPPVANNQSSQPMTGCSEGTRSKRARLTRAADLRRLPLAAEPQAEDVRQLDQGRDGRFAVQAAGFDAGGHGHEHLDGAGRVEVRVHGVHELEPVALHT